MTTIGADSIIREKPVAMGFKRIYVNLEYLAEYISLIRYEIQTNIEPELFEAAKTKWRVPYRITNKHFHDSEISQIVDSALLLLHRDKQNISREQWMKYVAIYEAIPTDNAASFYQPGTGRVSFYDDADVGTPSMLELADEIADYIEQEEIRVPYLRHRGTSYKIVGSLAIIYAGHKLKEKA